MGTCPPKRCILECKMQPRACDDHVVIMCIHAFTSNAAMQLLTPSCMTHGRFGGVVQQQPMCLYFGRPLSVVQLSQGPAGTPQVSKEQRVYEVGDLEDILHAVSMWSLVLCWMHGDAENAGPRSRHRPCCGDFPICARACSSFL